MTILAYTPDFNGEQAIYGIIFVLIIAYNFRVGFLKVFVDDDEDAVSYATSAPAVAPAAAPATPVVVKTVAPVRKKSRKPFSEDDWDEICRMAIDDAKGGDHRAREWVVKHVLKKEEVKDKISTPKTVIEDAVETLRSMGHSKAEATRMVNQAVKSKKYHSVESLLKDIYKKG